MPIVVSVTPIERSSEGAERMVAQGGRTASARAPPEPSSRGLDPQGTAESRRAHRPLGGTDPQPGGEAAPVVVRLGLRGPGGGTRFPARARRGIPPHRDGAPVAHQTACGEEGVGETQRPEA